MKKVIFTLLSFGLLSGSIFAQYCGNSGTSVCQPSGTLSQPGLSPPSDSLPSVVNGTAPNTVIQFKNFNTFVFGGQQVTVQTLRVDTLRNLPSGLCWATNKANNTWANQEDGCIKISGTACDNPGQYKLKIIVTANIGLDIQTDADAAGLKYFVRLINSGDSEVAVDTNQTVGFAKPAGYSATAVCGNGIFDSELFDNSLRVTPNPFNSKALVSFNSDKSGLMTERMTNIIGSEVYRKSVEVRLGENTSLIERNNLPAGVYFYSISDGKSLAIKRVVISE